MKIFRTILFLFLIALAFLGGYWWGRRFRLPGQAKPPAPRVLYWVDPMHPAYKSDKPGIAPDCGMKLEPVYEGGEAAQTQTGTSVPPGTVQISPEKQQLIGVRYGQVEMTGGSRTIRAAGKVSFDETRIAHVHTKVEGWIDKVFVDFAGKLVEKGQPLVTIYSPDMLASQRELLIAAKGRNLMKNNPLESAVNQSESLFQATRQRLELWDLSDAQIDQVLKTGEPIKNITLYLPISGYVLERKAFANVKVTPDTDLYVMADLSKVWIIADVFEYEAPQVRVGQSARVSLAYGSGRSFVARVSYIQPEVDPTTRTLKVRMEADNPAMTLKPDMYVDVDFRIETPPALTVPAEAVLDSGDRKTVFVDRGNGYFEPRLVQTGERSGDRIAVLKGLKAGERIVISGNFLIDSESQLKAAASGMAKHD